MNDCPRISGCPLFKHMLLKSVFSVWRTFYCETDFGKCERWKLASAGKPVPTSLLPNGRTLDVPLERLSPKHFE